MRRNTAALAIILASSCLVLGQNSTFAALSSTTATPSVNLFINGDSPSMGYAASIITACADQTVYALQCTNAGDDEIASEACGPGAPILSLTEGSTLYSISYTTQTTIGNEVVSATAIESCSLAGTTAAICAATIGGTVDGTSTTVSASTTLSGYDYYRYQVAITAGADKTASATATCGTAGVDKTASATATYGTKTNDGGHSAPKEGGRMAVVGAVSVVGMMLLL